MQALRDVIDFKNGDHPIADRLVGYDLAAAESGIPQEDFLDLINLARDSGLHITVHSGEDTDAAHVRKSIELLKAERIGHGIRSIDDESVMNLVRDKNIHLEISLTSNWLTKTVPGLADHPIKQFYEKGISISINTDDAHLMDIDLVHEYQLIANNYGLNVEDFMKINKEALEHSFLSEEIKDNIREKYFE